MDAQKLCKILRYIFQFIIVYLVLRYVPQLNMETSNAAVISLVLVSLCVILEFFYSKILIITNDVADSDCNSCNTCVQPEHIEKFTEPSGVAEPLYNVSQTNNAIPQIPTTPSTQQTIRQFEVASEAPAVKNILHPVQEMPKIIVQEMERPVQEMHPMSDMVPLPSGIPKMEQVQEEQREYPTMGTTMDVTPFYLAGNNKNQEKEMVKDYKYQREREAALEESAYSLKKMEHPYQIPGKKSEINRAQKYDPRNDGYIINEMDYSDFDFNSLPVARGYKTFADEYGYSFIPPEQWFATPPRAPVCVTTNREPVMPMWTTGAPVDVKDFAIASKISGPLGLSVNYVNDKLNAGR